MVKDMTPLRAQIVAARAYEDAWNDVYRVVPPNDPAEALAQANAMAHRRAAEIMEAEAAKEEGGEG